MKPLRPSTAESLISGMTSTTAGIGFALATVVEDGVPSLAVVGVVAVLYGLFMYFAGLRRQARSALASSEPVAAPELESNRRTYASGIGPYTGVALLCALWLLLLGEPLEQDATVFAAILLGTGFALLAQSRGFAKWQARHGLRVLREPGWSRARRCLYVTEMAATEGAPAPAQGTSPR